MSLLEARMTACVRLIELGGTDPDGLGGVDPIWAEGERFDAALVHRDTTAVHDADKTSAADEYSVLTRRTTRLRFHDVFRRLADGAVFRVLSNADDALTPDAAALDLRAARAERWEVPT